jgi:hypothetical protein
MTLEEKVEEMKTQRRDQQTSSQEDDVTTFTEATTTVTAATPDHEFNPTDTFSSCGSSDDSDLELEDDNMGIAFLQNAMGMFESIAIPSFTNCVATTKGVYDQAHARAERACIKGPPGRKKKKVKKTKREKQARRKSTSAINTKALVRSSEKMLYMCGDGNPATPNPPIMMKDSKTGLPYF